MNMELLDTIDGRATLIAMHAEAMRGMFVGKSDLPEWQTKAENSLDKAEKALIDAMADILIIKGQIKDARRAA